jgi:hypothetical protein
MNGRVQAYDCGSMTLPHWLIVSATAVLIAGRFHPLFRINDETGNWPTRTSSWMRFGSVVVFNILAWLAIIIMIRRAP